MWLILRRLVGWQAFHCQEKQEDAGWPQLQKKPPQREAQVPVDVVRRDQVHSKISCKRKPQGQNRRSHTRLPRAALIPASNKVKSHQRQRPRNQQPISEAKKSFYVPLDDCPI